MFGPGFLDDHAGHIIDDPKIALVELVANCWDAGARRVDIKIEGEGDGKLSVEDDGTGMTRAEFEDRWRRFSYNRIENQGVEVAFPEPSKTKRKAFGRNGKGRHGLFCFSDEYGVETWRNGETNVFRVQRENAGQSPFAINHVQTEKKPGHGTRLTVAVERNALAVAEIRELVGSRFVSDPSFGVWVNGERIGMVDLKPMIVAKRSFDIKNVGHIELMCIDAKEPGRIMSYHGVAWWVNGRLVGTPSWEGLDGSFIDGRTSGAKRYTFIVQADCMADDVRADWSAFKDSKRTKAVQAEVYAKVQEILREVMRDAYTARKKAALEENATSIRALTPLSQDAVGSFLERVQEECPTLSQKDLVNVTTVLVQLEESRSGYDLLRQLAQLPLDDLDALHDILQRWTVRDAQIVLDELHRRLKLIQDLERLAEDPKSRELADLQPLFEHGLWIFGPEYESVHFTSNRTLSTAVAKLFNIEAKDAGAERPDFVAIPRLKASVAVFSSDSYDKDGEASGVSKVLILELKKGAFTLTRDEVQQAQNYAAKIRSAGKVSNDTSIVAFVLGASIAPDAGDVEEKPANRILPRTYASVIRQAHNRTFHLIEKIRKHAQVADKEVRELVAQKSLELEPMRVESKTPSEGSKRAASPTATGR